MARRKEPPMVRRRTKEIDALLTAFKQLVMLYADAAKAKQSMLCLLV